MNCYRRGPSSADGGRSAILDVQRVRHRGCWGVRHGVRPVAVVQHGIRVVRVRIAGVLLGQRLGLLTPAGWGPRERDGEVAAAGAQTDAVGVGRLDRERRTLARDRAGQAVAHSLELRGRRGPERRNRFHAPVWTLTHRAALEDNVELVRRARDRRRPRRAVRPVVVVGDRHRRGRERAVRVDDVRPERVAAGGFIVAVCIPRVNRNLTGAVDHRAVNPRARHGAHTRVRGSRSHHAGERGIAN